MCKEASDPSIQGPCTTATIYTRGSAFQAVWGAHSLSECMDGDEVATAWLWKTLKGAVILCCSVSLSTLKCTVFEIYQYFSRAAFTVRCGRIYCSLLAESQEFKGSGNANLLEHRRQNCKVSNEENLFLRLQYIIRHCVAVHTQEGKIQSASVPSGGE